MRNRRFVLRKGPLVIYDGPNTLTKAFRNLPGVDLVRVDNLSVLDLAPGGHLGRLCIWTRSAFDKLDKLFGDGESKSKLKKNYILPKPFMSNSDLHRIINSDEVQSKLKQKRNASHKLGLKKKNPLKNRSAMDKLNPFEHIRRKRATAFNNENRKKRQETKKANREKRGTPKTAEERKFRSERKAASRAFYEKMNKEGEIKF